MTLAELIKALLSLGLPTNTKALKAAVLEIEDPIVFAILFGAD